MLQRFNKCHRRCTLELDWGPSSRQKIYLEEHGGGIAIEQPKVPLPGGMLR